MLGLTPDCQLAKRVRPADDKLTRTVCERRSSDVRRRRAARLTTTIKFVAREKKELIGYYADLNNPPWLVKLTSNKSNKI